MTGFSVLIFLSIFLQLASECSCAGDYEARVARLEAKVGLLTETLEELGYPSSRPQTCQEILWKDRTATSGEYVLWTKSGKIINKAYCEMGLNGGGYTFLSAQSLATLNNDDIQSMFNDNTNFLLRVRKTDGSQRYAVLRQLHQYSNFPLVIGKSMVPRGYGGLANAGSSHIGSDQFIYFAFMPAGPNRDVLGIKVNSVEIRYQHCGEDTSEHFTFFPNFKERLPYEHKHGTSPFLQAVLANTRQTPSFRGLPEQFFMFTEMHFSGCGVFTDSVTLLSQNGVSGMAMGFR